MNTMDLPATTIDPFPPASVTGELGKVRCPHCGRQVTSLRCGHCGSTLPEWQSDLFGSAIRQIAKLGGGRRTDTGHEGGSPETAEEPAGRDDADFVPSGHEATGIKPRLKPVRRSSG